MKKIIFLCGSDTTLILFLCAILWLGNGRTLISLLSNPESVFVENGVLVYSSVERKGVAFWMYWFFEKIIVLNIGISFSGRAMFFTVVKHNEKRQKLFSKYFHSSSFTETKIALTKSKKCWVLVSGLLPAFCRTLVLTYSLDSVLSL